MQPLVPALVGAHKMGGTLPGASTFSPGIGRLAARAASAYGHQSLSLRPPPPLPGSCTEGFQLAQKKKKQEEVDECTSPRCGVCLQGGTCIRQPQALA